MDFAKYQARLEVIRQTYKLSEDKQKFVVILGLFEEAGEVVGLVKKSFRDDTPLDFENLKKELGDFLAYLTLLGQVFDISLEEIAAQSRLNGITQSYNFSYDELQLDVVMGLCEVTGEVVRLARKIFIGDAPIYFVNLKKELGDAFAYLTLLGQVYDVSLEEIAETNLIKLEDRMARNTLKGSGNDR